jgi:Bacteriophage Lambda NinG protein
MSAEKKKLEKKLDDVFSKIVRIRDLGKKCITCDEVLNYQITCGHFMHRRHLGTRWDLKNAYGQCPVCNVKDDTTKFEEALIAMGVSVDYLKKKAQYIPHYTISELQIMYEALQETFKTIQE